MNDLLDPIRFRPMGPDVFGLTQPRELLAAIAEEGEPLLELIHQHVVSIQSFRPETLLQRCVLLPSFRAIPIATAVTTHR